MSRWTPARPAAAGDALGSEHVLTLEDEVHSGEAHSGEADSDPEDTELMRVSIPLGRPLDGSPDDDRGDLRDERPRGPALTARLEMAGI